jgi:hypothetical protein
MKNLFQIIIIVNIVILVVLKDLDPKLVDAINYELLNTCLFSIKVENVRNVGILLAKAPYSFTILIPL